jgi:DNA-directed RNA polymerase specialized sigma24 family protein
MDSATVLKNYKQLHAVTWRYTRDLEEEHDIVSDTVLSALTSSTSGLPNALSYLCTTARHKLQNSRERHDNSRCDPLEDTLTTNPPQNLIDFTLTISSFVSPYREICYMYLTGYNRQEIVKKLGINQTQMSGYVLDLQELLQK